MLALVARFLAMPDKAQLHSFLRAKPEAISVPFLSWLADQEANAVGEQKRVLAGICEELVVFRENLEEERLDALYTASLAALSAGEADPDGAVLALAADPRQYATRLAEAVTGSPVRTEGFDPVYDVLLKVAPPAALTPEGVAKGHQLAQELAVDLRSRRKRSVQSMIGRAQLTPEQADRLLAGSNASRILDLLLTLPSTADRLACLPDCFTPPATNNAITTTADNDDDHGERLASDGASNPTVSDIASTNTHNNDNDNSIAGNSGVGGPGPAMSAPSPSSEVEELVWCTPSQLLVELEARLQRLGREEPGPRPGGGPEPALLTAPGRESQGAASAAGAEASGLVGEALLAELRLLRGEVRRTWLDSLEVQ